MNELAGDADDFDPIPIIDAYRETIAKLESAPDDAALQLKLCELRQAWIAGNGGDSRELDEIVRGG